MNRVRFWHHHTAPVRLTLTEGETLTHAYGNPTDEGWYREWHIWTLEDGVVRCEFSSEARDCDGRFDYHAIMECEVDRLTAGPNGESGIRYPSWERVESGQRDYSAEAAGY